MLTCNVLLSYTPYYTIFLSLGVLSHKPLSYLCVFFLVSMAHCIQLGQCQWELIHFGQRESPAARFPLWETTNGLCFLRVRCGLLLLSPVVHRTSVDWHYCCEFQQCQGTEAMAHTEDNFHGPFHILFCLRPYHSIPWCSLDLGEDDCDSSLPYKVLVEMSAVWTIGRALALFVIPPCFFETLLPFFPI